MFVKIRPRRSTKAEWEVVDPVLKEGEFAIELPDAGAGSGLCKMKIGDGYTKWSELGYAMDPNAASAIYGGSVSVSHDICLRSGTTDQWESFNPILSYGEIVFDSSYNAFKCGDGEHAFKDLEYIGYYWRMDEDYDFGDLDDPEIDPSVDREYDFGDIDAL